MDKQAKDFIFSIVLIAVGVFALVGGIDIVNRAAQPPYRITTFSISPGFFPVVLGATLILCSILLWIQSLKGKGGLKAACKDNWGQFCTWFKPAVTSKNTITMTIGAVIMAVYSFLLVGWLPHWLASFIFLVGIMLFLKAAKWWKVLIISAGAVGLVIILFQICFHAALP